MLRDLSTVIEELHEALSGYGRAAQAGMRLSKVDITLPMDFRPILRDGADAPWIDQSSRAQFTWQLVDSREFT